MAGQGGLFDADARLRWLSAAGLRALSEHHVTVGMIKNGKRVERLMLMWQEKTAEEKRQVFREIERCSVGRSARIRNTVEAVTF